MSEPILTLENLKKYYQSVAGSPFSRQHSVVKAVDGVSFAIHPGETLGLVGGKATTASCVLRLQTPTSGTVSVNGANIGALRGEAKAAYHKSVQAVFQDPYGSRNPRQLVAIS